jgi:hypothetical protein
MIPLRIAIALLTATPVQPTANVTWIEQAMASLTCTGLATDAERAALAAPAIGETRDVAVLRGFFQAPPRDARHARYRHLATLSTVAWWAGRINDQELRGDALANILGLAQQAAAAERNPLLFRQIQQCALAQIVIVSLEQERFDAADNLAAALLTTPRTAAVEDWPLLLALREARLVPDARTITARLATALITTAGAAVAAGDSARGSRLYAAISQALDAVGEPRARDVALQSLVLSGRPPKPGTVWSVFPVLFDAQRRTTSMRDAMGLAQLVTPTTPPATLADQRAIFATMHRLAMIADAREDFEAGGQHRLTAFRALNSVGALDPPSLLFLRSGLAELLGPRDTTMRTVARARPAWGRETLADYLRAPATLTAQAATQFVSDAPARTIERYKIDSNLRALMQLHEAMPPDRARIEDAAFRLAQLRSFGRLTLATLTAELARRRCPRHSALTPNDSSRWPARTARGFGCCCSPSRRRRTATDHRMAPHSGRSSSPWASFRTRRRNGSGTTSRSCAPTLPPSGSWPRRARWRSASSSADSTAGRPWSPRSSPPTRATSLPSPAPRCGWCRCPSPNRS